MTPVQQETHCGGDCSQCLDKTEAGGAPQGVLTGWRMALAAGQCFLMPVLLAAVGAVWNGPALGGQMGGAVAGLAVGILMAVAVTRFIIPSEEKS